MKAKCAPQIVFEKLTNLRSLACMVYDRALAANLSNEELVAALEPVQTEYTRAVSAAVENDLDGSAAAIELFDHMAEAQIKYAAEIAEKAKDLREAAQQLRDALANSMHDRGEEIRVGELYRAALVEGIGDGGVRKHQLVIR